MKPAAPSREFLAAQVRWAMGRGLPPQVAEDVVHEAWEKASRSFDPRRGTFEAFMQRLVRNDCAGWWRRHGVRDRKHQAPCEQTPSPADHNNAPAGPRASRAPRPPR